MSLVRWYFFFAIYTKVSSRLFVCFPENSLSAARDRIVELENALSNETDVVAVERSSRSNAEFSLSQVRTEYSALQAELGETQKALEFEVDERSSLEGELKKVKEELKETKQYLHMPAMEKVGVYYTKKTKAQSAFVLTRQDKLQG
jgi:septal ring factor EnvC (AmiA/AmiB activator)